MKKENSRMRAIACFAVLITVATTVIINKSSNSHAQKIKVVPDPGEAHVPGRILVKFNEHILPAHARNIIAALGARDADQIPNIGVHILDLPYQASERAFVASFKASPEVEFTELDQIVAPSDVIPNDPWYAGGQWHLPKISAPASWSATTGNGNVIVAILDTGVDVSHEDLAANVVPGWNIHDGNSNTADVHGHGTNVAGTPAARGNNALGVASLCWQCKIMPIRISDGSATRRFPI